LQKTSDLSDQNNLKEISGAAMRIGIIGAGFAGKFHYTCLSRIYAVPIEISGIFDLDPKSRDLYTEKTGVKSFSSLQDLIDTVDVVDICVPPYAHEEMIVLAANADKDIIVEKPLTGYFGRLDEHEGVMVRGIPKSEMLADVIRRLERISEAVEKGKHNLCYAENFVYAPAIQKEAEIIKKSGAQILRMIGEESHNGSESQVYGMWKFSGGGSLIGKGVHPLGAILYFKRVEGIARNGKPIRPAMVNARVHEITRLDGYQDKGYIRTDYEDVEDYGFIHVIFDDGTVADVITSELVLGGIYDWVEVYANNHRSRCRLSPTNLVETYSPSGKEFKDIYLMEKLSSKEGWAFAAPDENLTMGYQQELQDFVESIHARRRPQSDLSLAIDITLTVYSAYVSAENGGAETNVPLL
jgi:predicted dehydrogenase